MDFSKLLYEFEVAEWTCLSCYIDLSTMFFAKQNQAEDFKAC